MDREQLKELIRTAPVLQETLDGLDAALAKSAPDVDAMRAKQDEIHAKLERIEDAKRQLVSGTPVAEAVADEAAPVAEVVKENEIQTPGSASE